MVDRKVLEKVYVNNFIECGDPKAYIKEKDKLRRRQCNRLGERCHFGTVMDRLIIEVSNCRQKLNKAREDANKIFKKYMKLKKFYNHGRPLDRHDMVVIKQEWKEVSRKVRLAKLALAGAELTLSNFTTWYNETNIYIQTLENIVRENGLK